MKPIIFLDFDGVLNYEAWLRNTPPQELSPACVEVLNEIVTRFGADVVISSSWRIGRTVGQLQDILEGCGFTHQILDKTKSLAGYRGLEILEWPQTHNRLGDPILIIDDSSDMVPYMHRLLRTTWQRGLRHEHIDRAEKILVGCSQTIVEHRYGNSADWYERVEKKEDNEMKAYSVVALNPDGSVATSTTSTNLVEQTTQNWEYILQMATPGQRVLQLEVGFDGIPVVTQSKVKS